MIDHDSPIKVYEGELSDVAFLISLLAAAGIHIVATGKLFGGREIYVRRSDEPAARDLVEDFESRKSRVEGHVVLRGPWPKANRDGEDH